MTKAWAATTQSYGPDRVQGKCTCGWRGPGRDTVMQADSDVLEHIRGPEGHWDEGKREDGGW